MNKQERAEILHRQAQFKQQQLTVPGMIAGAPLIPEKEEQVYAHDEFAHAHTAGIIFDYYPFPFLSSNKMGAQQRLSILLMWPPTSQTCTKMS